jgi:DNA polymerase III alpha subunit
MGFYSPATITKDAQRHGLKMLPVDVSCSEWLCTLEAAVSSTQYLVPSKTLVIPTPERKRGAEESRFQKLPIANCQLPIETSSYQSISYQSIKNQQSTIKLGSRQSAIDNALRLGLRYVRGLREEAAQALVRERMRAPFMSIHDLTRRVPELRKDELTTLAEIGALNAVAGTKYPVPGKTFVIPTPERKRGAEESRFQELPTANCQLPIETRTDFQSTLKNQQSTIGTRKLAIGSSFHRRDALWQVEQAVRASGPLLENLPESDSHSPLQPMNQEERLVADFHGTGLTVGPHPMAYRRDWLNAMGIRRASDLRHIPSGKRLRIGGCVITRQRPGTAKGFVFVSLEDETGVANAIIAPDLFHSNRLLLASERFLAIEGILQNQDNVISVRAERVQPLFVTKAQTTSHDFH